MQGWIYGVMAWLMVATAALAGSDTAVSAVNGKAVDPKAVAIVRSFTEKLKSFKTFSFTLISNIKSENEGMRQEYFSTASFALARPGKVAMVLTKGFMGGSLVSDGKDVSLYIPMSSQYAVKKAPEQLSDDSMLEMATMISGGGFPIMRTFLVVDPGADMLDGVTRATMLDVEKIGGVKCQHIRFEQDDFDWEAWFEVGDKTLLRKIKVDMSKAMRQMMDQQAGAEMPPMMRDMRSEVGFQLDAWSVDKDLPADTFKFNPPPSARKVASLFPEQEEGADATASLLGQPAPAFKLPLLAGGEFDLAAFKGKKVVVLDFWATWCGPCRKAMPILSATTAKFKDKDVVFCAINQGETADDVKKFLKDQGIECPVALDNAQVTAPLFQVTGIPHCVIIDKQGVVQAVHVGVLPNYGETLTAELEQVTSGKSLIPAAPPAE